MLFESSQASKPLAEQISYPRSSTLSRALMTALLFIAAVILCAVVGALFSGCATEVSKTEQTCAGVDWWEVGRMDGVNGLAMSRVNEYRNRCDKTSAPINIDLYSNGREAGLVEFCSPTRAREAGYYGQPYEHVCPSFLEPAFQKSYSEGQRLKALETEHAQLDTRIRNLNKLDGPGLINPLHNELRDLRARLNRVEDEISTIQVNDDEAL